MKEFKKTYAEITINRETEKEQNNNTTENLTLKNIEKEITEL